MKLGGQVESVKRTNRLNLGEDSDPINFFSDSSQLRDGAKNHMQHDIAKRCRRIMTKLGGRVGYVTRTSRLDFGSGPEANPAYGWDAKRKLFSLAEARTLVY